MARFPRSARLLKPADFKRVIKNGRRRRSLSFTAYEVEGLAAPQRVLFGARVGLAVSRKSMPRAVDRNRFKRIVRETFRNKPQLPRVDVVIMATPRARSLGRIALAAELNEYWKQLQARWPVSSSS